MVLLLDGLLFMMAFAGLIGGSLAMRKSQYPSCYAALPATVVAKRGKGQRLIRGMP